MEKIVGHEYRPTEASYIARWYGYGHQHDTIQPVAHISHSSCEAHRQRLRKCHQWQKYSIKNEGYVTKICIESGGNRNEDAKACRLFNLSSFTYRMPAVEAIGVSRPHPNEEKHMSLQFQKYDPLAYHHSSNNNHIIDRVVRTTVWPSSTAWQPTTDLNIINTKIYHLQRQQANLELSQHWQRQRANWETSTAPTATKSIIDRNIPRRLYRLQNAAKKVEENRRGQTG